MVVILVYAKVRLVQHPYKTLLLIYITAHNYLQ